MPSPRAVVESAAARTEHVITTRECLRLGADRDWVERQVTSGRWRRVARGVLVTYSGPPTWRTRATAALAHAGRGGLLSHDAAAFLHGITTTPPRVIDVTIPRDRRVVSVPGVRMHRRARRRATRRRGLAVVAAGDAVLDLVERAQGVDRVVGVLCDAVRAGIDADAVLLALAHRPAQRRRRLVLELLGQVAGGIESPLEGTGSRARCSSVARWSAGGGSGPTRATSGSACGPSWTASSHIPADARMRTPGGTTPSSSPRRS